MGEHARKTRQRHRDDLRPPTARGTEDISPAILAASADGVVAIDDDGIIRSGNRAAAELLGLPPHDLVGRPLGHEIVAGQAAEIEVKPPGGAERVLDVRTTATTVAGQRLRIAMLRDITQRKRSERALEAALDQQSAALAVAAHELHSPLAAIGVLAHVLADQQVTMALPERATVAERIAELAERLQMLMRRLLTSLQIESEGSRTAPEPVRVLEVIIDQLALVHAQPGAISVRCSPGLAVSADRAELTMMLANYVDNALTYAAPPVEILAAERDGWAVIEVSDHGPGVPRSFEPLLFERFARAPEAERSAAGIGLGLWIVRTLAQAHGGDAWYEPGERSGSRFYLRLPLPASDA